MDIYQKIFIVIIIISIVATLGFFGWVKYSWERQNVDLGTQIAAEYDIPVDLAIELVDEARYYRTNNKVSLDDGTVFNASTGELFNATEYKYGNTSSIYYEKTGEQYQYFHIYEKLVKLVYYAKLVGPDGKPVIYDIG